MIDKKKGQVVTKETVIQDILDGYPNEKFFVITKLSEAGLKVSGEESCVSETFEKALLDRGSSEDKLTALVGEINNIVAPELPTEEDVALTDFAAQKVEALLKADGKEAWGLRFALKTGGCNGLEYDFSFQESAAEGENTYEFGSVRLFVPQAHLEKLIHSEIDYKDSLMDAGFKVNNPNVIGSCGCGVSNTFR